MSNGLRAGVVESHYLECVLRPGGVAAATKAVTERFAGLRLGHIDAVAFTGVSGAVVAPAVAAALGIGLLAVRKGGERSHSPFQIEGTIPDRYIIVDDLIATGTTINRIIEKIKAWRPNAVCVGVFLYNDSSSGSYGLVDDVQVYGSKADVPLDILTQYEWSPPAVKPEATKPARFNPIKHSAAASGANPDDRLREWPEPKTDYSRLTPESKVKPKRNPMFGVDFAKLERELARRLGAPKKLVYAPGNSAVVIRDYGDGPVPHKASDHDVPF